MRLLGVVGGMMVLMGLMATLQAIDLDVTPADLERALAIARSSERERAAFHAPYIQTINTPAVETVEIVSEYRRVVLIAEDRARKGDRAFTYSVSDAQKAIGPWHHRVAFRARLRFHPQNNYIDVPPIDVVLEGHQSARVGVVREPLLGFAGRPSDGQPVLGAVVDGVFDAVAVGQGPRQFVVSLEKKEIGRYTFDLAALQ